MFFEMELSYVEVIKAYPFSKNFFYHKIDEKPP